MSGCSNRASSPLQVLSERNREIKALEKEKNSLAKRISGVDAFASPRPHTATSHPSTPARATPRLVTEQTKHCQLQLGASPATGTIASPLAELENFHEIMSLPQEHSVGAALSMGTFEEAPIGGSIEEELEGEREVAEEEKRRRLELKAIDNEVLHLCTKMFCNQ
jgi:hypothetical protein